MELARLGEWRRRKCLTTRELAAASGVGPSAVNRLELRRQLARPATVRKLAAALGCEPADLMTADALQYGSQPEDTPTTEQK